MEISIAELEQVRNDYAEVGRRLERERIIKLLEDEAWGDGNIDCSLKHLIALIKGENNG